MAESMFPQESSGGGLTSPVAIADGGTGATTAALARTALGLGTAAVENTPIALNKGGTGATTASGARTALELGTAATAASGDFAAASHAHAGSAITSGTVGVSYLPAMVGDSGSGGTAGLVPAPASGDALKFLRGDGTWQAAGGATENVMRRVTAATGVSTFGTDLQTLITAASSGDWVQVISGTISTKTITLKSGVNLRFEDGVLLSDVKFQDNGVACTCTIDGVADVTNMNNVRLIDLTHASSVVRATFGKVVGSGQPMLAMDTGSQLFIRTFGACDWSSATAVQVTGGSKCYYDFDELKCGQASGSGTYCDGANSEIWLRGRKIWTAVAGKIAYNDSGGGGYQNIDVDTIQGTHTNDPYGLLYPNTGTIDVRARLITSSAGPAVYGNMSGNMTIRGARIQSTKNSATLGVPIDMGGAAGAGRLTLHDCVLLSHSAASVSIIATASNDVYVHGVVLANEDKDSDITIRAGGTFAFDTTYVL